LAFIPCSVCSQSTGYGIFYSYGARFNLHKSNPSPLRPTDGSAAGVYFQLDNGEDALGFRASLAMCHYDAVFGLEEDASIRSVHRDIEMKLQCTLPIRHRSMLAFGIAPSVMTMSRILLEYSSRSNGHVYGEQHEIPLPEIPLNALNTSLCLSWYYQIHGRFVTALHLDQQMLTIYDGDVNLKQLYPISQSSINLRHTALMASMIFRIK
jgi:hypothetical protein